MYSLKSFWKVKCQILLILNDIQISITNKHICIHFGIFFHIYFRHKIRYSMNLGQLVNRCLDSMGVFVR